MFSLENIVENRLIQFLKILSKVKFRKEITRQIPVSIKGQGNTSDITEKTGEAKNLMNNFNLSNKNF